MTNPNNAVGTNAAYSGRTSPNALNDILASFGRGILSGWTCAPKTGMTIQVGGISSIRDVALAEDNAGNKLTINNRSGAPIDITLVGAPSTNNRVDVIVAYVDNPSIGDGNTTDNPTACGIIAVSGAVAANPTAPDDASIRAAITTDGATGGTAYYVVLATILVGTNVTTIGSGVITQGVEADLEKNYYQPGDKFSTAYTVSSSGTLTTGGTRIYTSIPVSKRLDKITTIQCTQLSGHIRPVTGGSLGGSANVDYSDHLVRCVKESSTSVNIVIDASAYTWSGTVPENNTPVAIIVSPGFTFS